MKKIDIVYHSPTSSTKRKGALHVDDAGKYFTLNLSTAA